MDLIASIGTKLVYTAVLLGLSAVLINEAYKVWAGDDLVISTFAYSKDGSDAAANGEAFVRRVLQQQRLLKQLFQHGDGGDNDPFLSEAVFLQFRIDEDIGVKLDASSLQDLKIEAQGVNITALLTRFRNWIRRPNTITGRIDELGGQLHVFATWKNTDDHEVFFHEIHKTALEASFRIAARLLWHDFKRAANPSALQEQMVDRLDENSFADFLWAWQIDRILSFANTVDDETLERARIMSNRLADGPNRFALVYLLAARFALDANDPQSAPLEKRRAAIGFLEAYLLEMTTLKLPQPRYAALLQTLRRLEAPAGPQVTSIDMFRAGASIAPAEVQTAATACCIVQRDGADAVYFLTPAYVFNSSGGLLKIGASVISPAAVDGGGADIGVLDSIIEDKATGARIALVRLRERVRFSNAISETHSQLSLSTVSEDAVAGLDVSLFGRSKTTRRGKIVGASGAHQVAEGDRAQSTLESLYGVRPAIGGPGDGGAPVFDDHLRLVGMNYAGSTEMSLILPLKPFFERHGLRLVQGQ